ncbi:MAG: twin-arginine translocation signal domain-containing protein [Firmicutes bacterium]|nr:twin-arginine translocation signal domain-containing protein [Bacillota bacterium]
MSITRRRFLKGTAAAAGALAAARLARVPGLSLGNGVAYAKTAETLDELYEISPSIQRFSERYTLFCRSKWDPPVMAMPRPWVTTRRSYSPRARPVIPSWTGPSGTPAGPRRT